MTGYETYKLYLSLKRHFTNQNYDYFKYSGKCRSSIESFERRKDKYFFKKLDTKYDPQTQIEYFVSQFIKDENLWIGNIFSKECENNYNEWKKRIQSLTYVITQDINNMLEKSTFEELFSCSDGKHPLLLKYYLSNRISIETMIILDSILNYTKDFNQKIVDPVVWPKVYSMMRKYAPFLKFDKSKYKQIIREKVLTCHSLIPS